MDEVQAALERVADTLAGHHVYHFRKKGPMPHDDESCEVDDAITALSTIRKALADDEAAYAKLAGEYESAAMHLRQAQARIEELEAALPDAGKLGLLADWFDQDDANKGGGGSEIQADLRHWARGIRQALSTSSDRESVTWPNGKPATCRVFTSCTKPVVAFRSDDEMGAVPYCAEHDKPNLPLAFASLHQIERP